MTTILEALKDATVPQPPDRAWRCGDVTIKHAHLHLLIEAAEALKKIEFDWDGEPEDMAEARTILAKLQTPLP